jgi:hypothetical protein
MLYLKAGWVARSESLASCRARLEAWLEVLAQVDALMVTWHESIEDSIDGVAVGADWRRMLEEGRIDAELGSVIAAWAGSEDGYGLTLHCGVISALIPNQLHLSIPSSGGFTGDLALSQGVIRETSQIWSPDYVVISDSSLGLEVEVESDGFQPGWMNCVTRGSNRSDRMRMLGWEEIMSFGDYVAFTSAETVRELAPSLFSGWRRTDR